MKKKIAFFHLGDTSIAAKVFAKKLGFDFLDIPKTNKNSVSKGLLVSPEFSCFPFKSIMGCFIQAAEMGADLLFMTTGSSITSCQSADFGVVQRNILRKKGYKTDMVILDGFKLKGTLKELRKHKPDLTVKTLSEIMVLFTQKFFMLEDVNQYSHHIHFSVGKKKADKFKSKSHKKIDATDSIFDLYALRNTIKEEYLSYPLVNYRNTLRIGVVGDIYLINDDYLNNNLFERILKLGAYGQKGIGPTMLFSAKFGFSVEDMFNKSKVNRYIKHNIGGYSQHTIKQTIKYAEEGFDGIIHLYPFNCMPETVVRSILPKVSEDYKIPILYLPIDELTGDAGFTTRLEAFIDLLHIKKKKREQK